MISVERLISGQPASSPDKPIEHLKACHRRIEDRLGVLARAGEHFERQPAEARAAIAHALAFFRTNGVLHTEDEEQSLFPRLRPLLAESEAVLVAELERQHEEAERLHAAVEAAAAELNSSPPPAGAVEGYRTAVRRLQELYREHIEAEDSRVFAVAERVLSGGHLREIAEEMRSRRPAGK